MNTPQDELMEQLEAHEADKARRTAPARRLALEAKIEEAKSDLLNAVNAQRGESCIAALRDKLQYLNRQLNALDEL